MLLCGVYILIWDEEHWNQILGYRDEWLHIKALFSSFDSKQSTKISTQILNMKYIVRRYYRWLNEWQRDGKWMASDGDVIHGKANWESVHPYCSEIRGEMVDSTDGII